VLELIDRNPDQFLTEKE
jgi:hypothetical protein